MLSGHATVDIAIEGMDRGAFDFLLKPCELDILMAKIEEAVQQKRRHEKKIEAARALQRSFQQTGEFGDG
jgi:FixJ family two-component response regulator